MKIQVLDGLRGYAALMVVAAHFPQWTEASAARWFKAAMDVSKIGYFGVELFFVLSGFLITRILIREKRERLFSFGTFYLKRALRIFPIYYLCLLYVGFLVTWDGMGYVALYVSNFYFIVHAGPHPMRHTWSLAIEEHFYLFWPLLIHRFSLENARRIILFGTPLLVTGTAVCVYALADTVTATEWVNKATPLRFLSLALGSLLAFGENRLPAFSRRPVWSEIGFVLLYAAALVCHRIPLPVAGLHRVLYLVLFSGASVLFFVAVLGLEQHGNRLRRWFTNPVIGFVGRISYGIYLYHYPILYLFGMTYGQTETGPVTAEAGACALLLIFAVPIFSYFVIERPLLQLKEKIRFSPRI